MKAGKLGRRSLEENVLRHFKTKRKELLLGPSFGIDFAVIQCGDSYLITSMDPVTGELDDPGWYSVHVSCNDVATSGNRPQFLETTIMLGEDEPDERAGQIATGMARAASRLGVDIVGGHTERTMGLDHSVAVTTALGFGRTYVTAAGAREGDVIMMTKTAGIEGTSILAKVGGRGLNGLDEATLRRAAAMKGFLSVVEEAEAAFRAGGVHAMHDPTEGGILGGLYEMSVASGVGFEVHEARIPVHPVTKKVASALSVDPLRLIASGSLLISVDGGAADVVAHALSSAKVRATAIGRFGGTKRVLLRRSGRREEVDETVQDELWKFMDEMPHRPKRL